MKRDAALLLVLGCVVILTLEAPVAMASMLDDLDGPYPEWETSSSAQGTPRALPDAESGAESGAGLDEAPEHARAAALASFRH